MQESWSQKGITAWKEQPGLLALVNYGFCLINVQKKTTNQLWETNPTCHWCPCCCITDSGSFIASFPSRSTLSKGQKSFLPKMPWCLGVSWSADTSASLLLLSERGRAQFFHLYRDMYFQHILLVALSTQEQSTLVVVSPTLGVHAAPFHPGGLLGAHLNLASSW